MGAFCLLLRIYCRDFFMTELTLRNTDQLQSPRAIFTHEFVVNAKRQFTFPVCLALIRAARSIPEDTLIFLLGTNLPDEPVSARDFADVIISASPRGENVSIGAIGPNGKEAIRTIVNAVETAFAQI